MKSWPLSETKQIGAADSGKVVVPFSVSHLATKEGRPGVSTRILKGGAAASMGVLLKLA
jgi:hypothetical protein